MMNHLNGWMDGGMWFWAVLGVVVVGLLAFGVGKLSSR